MIKNLPASAGDVSLILRSGRSPGEGNSNPLHSLAWESPWTENPGELQSMGLQHSLAWESPWTEDPGELQSMGLQKSQIQLSD